LFSEIEYSRKTNGIYPRKENKQSKIDGSITAESKLTKPKLEDNNNKQPLLIL
jgi:hypothetical protein